MRLFYILLFVTYVSCHTDVKPEKIIGGQYLTITDAPYHATLYYLGDLFCSAAIIAENWLLSAEKCFINKVSVKNNVKVRTGISYSEGGRATPFTNVKLIEKYSHDYPDSDKSTNLVLILLEDAIKLHGKQNRIAMENSNADIPPGSLMNITGFGKSHPSNIYPATWLFQTTLKVVDKDHCPSASYRLFCATDPHSDASDYDEGGPGVINNTLVAIITGTPNNKKGSVGVYTKVGFFYHWILRHTGLRQ